MATNLPKVQGYVPQSVFDALIEYKDKHGLRSTSEALTAVLEAFFGLSPHHPTFSGSLVNQSEWEERMQRLEQQVQMLTQAYTSGATLGITTESESESKGMSESSSELASKSDSEAKSESSSELDSELLTIEEFAERYNIKPDTMKAYSYKSSEEIRAWSKKKVGYEWDKKESIDDEGKPIKIFFRVP